MASTVEVAGTRTSETIGQKLADAIGGMEARQNIMNERMTEFVEQIRNLVRDSQSETNQKLQITLSEIGEAVRAQICALKERGDQASASHSEREGRVAAQTQEMLRQLGSQVDVAIGSLQAQSEQATTAQLERERRMAAQADDTVATLPLKWRPLRDKLEQDGASIAAFFLVEERFVRAESRPRKRRASCRRTSGTL